MQNMALNNHLLHQSRIACPSSSKEFIGLTWEISTFAIWPDSHWCARTKRIQSVMSYLDMHIFSQLSFPFFCQYFTEQISSKHCAILEQDEKWHGCLSEKTFFSAIRPTTLVTLVHFLKCIYMYVFAFFCIVTPLLRYCSSVAIRQIFPSSSA